MDTILLKFQQFGQVTPNIRRMIIQIKNTTDINVIKQCYSYIKLYYITMIDGDLKDDCKTLEATLF